MNNKLINITLCIVGLVGMFLFYNGPMFMLVMSVVIFIFSILLAIISIDAEWGNPYEWLKDLRKRKKRPLIVRGSNKERAFVRVQNAINNGKVFASQEEDGIYIRLAGNENEGEAYTEEKVKIYSYDR